ncbi:hypothetical protein EBZ38_01420 [bacterium]|nr:hypothetical protein [bacterium]NDD82929.1 hypothetical protein [bacterium]
MERIDAAIREEMELRNMLDYLDFLLEHKKISQEESVRLDQMLNSRDQTDYLIAKTILNTHYGYTFSTPGT